MSALKTLIQEYTQDAREFEDLREMYEADARDVEVVLNSIQEEQFKSASVFVDRMDTSAREEVIIAIAKDFGTEFVSENFGYNVEGWV